MYRLDGGRPIRKAMNEAGLSIESCAAKSKTVDPLGYGISRSVIGHMVSEGPSGRDSFSDRTCDLMALALTRDVHDLFTTTRPS